MVPDLSSLPTTTPPEASPRREDEDDELSLQKWVRLLAGRWSILIAGAAIGALLGVAATARPPRLYEAAATVLLTPAPDPSGLFNSAGGRTILTSQAIATQVLEELRAGGYAASPQEFLADALVVEDITSNLFRVRVRLQDPQLAARAATRTAERAVERMSGLWREIAVGKPTLLERQVEQARLALIVAEQRLSEHLQRNGRRSSVRSSETVAGDAPLPTSRAPGPVYPIISERGRLEAEVEIRRRTYIEAGARHEQARIELLSADPPMRLIDAATVPVQPLPRPRARTVALGLIAGLIAAACAVVAREWRVPPAAARGQGPY